MRILQLSTHTTLVPRHGGMLRSHHIGRVIEQAGLDLRRLAFAHRSPEHRDDPREPLVNPGPLPFWSSDAFRAYGDCRWLVSDYLSAVAALEAPELLAEFDTWLAEAEPDLILLEHPWTWPLLARHDAVRSGALRCAPVRSGALPVVYSSQNVELTLKRQIIDQADAALPPPLREALQQGIGALERGLVAAAAGVVACTAADAAVFAEWGARRVVVAPNGGVRQPRGHLIDVLPDGLSPDHAFALVVGSMHPPNISGFLDLVVPALPRLAPHHRVVVAGDAGIGILQAMEARGLSRLVENRVVALGRVATLTLDCLLANAQVVLVPILYGGGSNVKTAEALLSGRPVIASGPAMRGFDAFRGTAALTVAEDAAAFGAALMEALDAPFRTSGPDDAALAPLLWESTIAPLVQLLREIGAAGSLGRPAA